MGLRLRSALPLATEGTQEVPSYEEGVGDDGGWQGNPCIIAAPYQGALNFATFSAPEKVRITGRVQPCKKHV